MKQLIQKFLNKYGYKIIQDFPRPMIKFLKSYYGSRKLTGCEIGVYKGENAEWILKTLNIKKLYLVDPYEDYENYHDAKNHYGRDQDSLKKAEIEADRRLLFDNVEWLKEKAESQEALFVVPNNLDFVYIDGNHQYEYVKQDLEIYYEKLKTGGVIGGDDIDNGLESEHDGVLKAVLEFVNNKGLKLHIAHNDWWVIKEDKR